MNVDDRGTLRGAARRLEHLSVNLEPIARLEERLLRRDELRGGKIGRHAIGSHSGEAGLPRADDRRQRRPLRVGAERDDEPCRRS